MFRYTRTTCKKIWIDCGGDYGVNVCDVCVRSFGIRRYLQQHNRTVRCDPNGPPSPKRTTYVASEKALVEDPLEAPLDGAVENDVLSDELQQLVRQYTHLGGQRSRSVDVQLPTDPAGHA